MQQRDRLEVQREGVADARQRRRIGAAHGADEVRAGGFGEFGELRRQRDDASRRPRKTHDAAEVVVYFRRCRGRDGRALAGGERRGRWRGQWRGEQGGERHEAAQLHAAAPGGGVLGRCGHRSASAQRQHSGRRALHT
ncbi:hypothetical protein GALL_399970 [mine drainage metagenome]|uniref:Uncharacterized protein n=1 Tax=mine drainage metagenome TaxID=410659 RepID=A0A1J5QE58_9ZZZZ